MSDLDNESYEQWRTEIRREDLIRDAWLDRRGECEPDDGEGVEEEEDDHEAD